MRKLCKAMLLLLLSLLLSGFEVAGQSTEEATDHAFFSYYLNKDATQIEKEAYQPSSENDSEILQDLMKRLGSRNSEERKSNLLPQEVTINSYEVQGQTLVIDFNSQYTKMGTAREVLTRAGIVKTFMQLSDIGAVRFTVMGEPLRDSKNQEIGDMRGDTFLEYSILSDEDSYRYDTITLYFADAAGSGLIPEKRSVYYRRNLSKERVVLEQLIKGPMEKGNYPTIADNTTVFSVSISDGVCYVNLSSYFLDSVAIAGEEIPIYSIVNSLTDSCGIEKVEISVEGNSNMSFSESISLFEFYQKNDALILQANPS